MAYKKFLTKAEAEALLAAGLAIGFNLESTAGRATVAGRAGGEADATDARVAIESCGLFLRPVFFSVDVNVTPAQFPAIADYFAGAVSVLGVENVGAYGESDLLDYLLSKKLISRTWRTAATAWSPAGTHTYDIVQGPNGQVLAGGDVDFDTSSNYQDWAVMPNAEEDMSLTFSVIGPPGTAEVVTANHQLFRLNDPTQRRTLLVGEKHPCIPIWLNSPLDANAGDRQTAVLFSGNESIPAEAALMSDVKFTPTPDVSAAVAAATAPLLAKIAAVKAALA